MSAEQADEQAKSRKRTQELKMPDANQCKQEEEGKASLEQYDVERAIGIVRELGEGLIAATAHSKHHFRKEWLDQLVERYRRQHCMILMREESCSAGDG
jgi:hypothetical protein